MAEISVRHFSVKLWSQSDSVSVVNAKGRAFIFAPNSKSIRNSVFDSKTCP